MNFDSCVLCLKARTETCERAECVICRYPLIKSASACSRHSEPLCREAKFWLWCLTKPCKLANFFQLSLSWIKDCTGEHSRGFAPARGKVSSCTCAAKTNSCRRTKTGNELRFEGLIPWEILAVRTLSWELVVHSVVRTVIHWVFVTYKTGCDVMTYAVHPGLVSTELGRHVHHPQQQQQQQRENKSFARRVISALSKTPSQGAQTSIHCALEPSLNLHSGCYYR